MLRKLCIHTHILRKTVYICGLFSKRGGQNGFDYLTKTQIKKY